MTVDPSSKRILLVEDDMFIRDLYFRQFTRAGFQIEAFDNGIDALEAVKKQTYDLILVDIMMPKMNGLELVKALKADDSVKSIPTYFLTNLGQDSILQEGMGVGVAGFFIKSSYTPDQLVAEVKKVFEQQAKSAVENSSLSS